MNMSCLLTWQTFAIALCACIQQAHSAVCIVTMHIVSVLVTNSIQPYVAIVYSLHCTCVQQ